MDKGREQKFPRQSGAYDRGARFDGCAAVSAESARTVRQAMGLM
jgi:hypothetical protein